MELHIDFETRGVSDLKKQGVHMYASHEHTDALCMAYGFDGLPIEYWRRGEPLPEEVRRHVAGGEAVVAHNAGFEWHIWNLVMAKRHGWPELRIEQMRCTAAQAAAMQLPRDLDTLARVLGAPPKDVEGHNLMMKMCRPKRGSDENNPEWHEKPEDLDRLLEYCMRDVLVEQAVDKRLLRLSQSERLIWIKDHEVNRRGVRVDITAVRLAANTVAKVAKALDEEMARITGGAVQKCTQTVALLAWIKGQGYHVPSLAKDEIEQWLAVAEDLGINGAVADAIGIRKEAAKASVAKLTAMEQCHDPADRRIRGMFLYHGAGTGRWTGRLVQLHNMPRPKAKMPVVERYIAQLHGSGLHEGGEMDAVRDVLRSMLVAAPGHEFICADFANVEGRVLACLAGQADLVDLFRRNGPVYETMGSKIFGVPVSAVTKDSLERQVGKQATLGCGYGMGAKKFADTCAKSGIFLDGDLALKAVKGYREANPKIVQFWASIETAAASAVNQPGEHFAVGPVAFKAQQSWLFCRLPSGRLLTYPSPKCLPRAWAVFSDPAGGEHRQAFFGSSEPDLRRKALAFAAKHSLKLSELKPNGQAITFMGQNPLNKQWERQSAYGGLLTENVVQAAARDLLADAMLRVEAAGYPVVMHVHDELVAEIPEGFGDLKAFEALMAATPTWASGWPIAAEGWRGKRYRK